MGKKTKNTIWIDLENTPHVLFFNPIIKELKKRGYKVAITARNYSQVFKLADLLEFDYMKIGRHYGKHTILKVLGTIIRAIQLIPFIIKEKPAIAIAHGSRSQFISCKLMGVKSATAFDYEYGFSIPILKYDFEFVPEVLYNKITNKGDNLYGYPGIKEDVYVPYFEPDEKCLDEFNFSKDEIIISIRPPATVAHYHRAKSDELFTELMQRLNNTPNVRIIMLPRVEEQAMDIRIKWEEMLLKKKMIIPSKVINGLDIIWGSDLVISGGGTMIREAAALNVPAYSIFGGNIGAVDEFLEKSGRLTILRDKNDIKEKMMIKKREKADKKNI